MDRDAEIDALVRENEALRRRLASGLREHAAVLRWCAYIGARLNAGPGLADECVKALNAIQRISGPLAQSEDDDLH